MISRKWMTSDKPRSATPRCQARVHCSHDCFLSAARIGNQRSGRAYSRHLHHALGDCVHRRCDNDQLRIRHAAPQVRDAPVNCPNIARNIQALLPPSDTNNSLSEPSLSQCQADGPAD
jgi:hypothetical protein